ncbi:penicillin-binding protein [Luteirhabdus pelagi]|uniref:penicillin-binding protein n=1 Tax=Luteirhabdus pelagi TaxID=2792783 RepID=UPI001939ECFF|nr:penicillin-binding protein [Luteirhabdus pelagi]
MAFEEKNILNRLYFIAGCMFIFAIAVTIQLLNIQFVEGEKYRELAERNTVKNFTIPANRGNVYADDGSLLATSVPKYDIRFDAVTVSNDDFKEFLVPLSKELSKMFGRPASYYQNVFRKARANKNRYLLVAKNLGYSDYIRVKSFPLFKKGPYRGGIIVEQYTVREHPLGKIAERLVGNEEWDAPGKYEVGFEGAFDDYLRGKEGKRLKQKIAKGQWKPVFDENEIEPQDGYDVISTIDVNIQDIAHHALLKQMEYYEAEHGSVIVMEVETGEIKAVSNLGRTNQGTYYEKLNYAVGESHEPGSTFKVMAMMAALEDKVIDTATVVDTKEGRKRFYGRYIHDSRRGGYGKISAARALEVSSNIGLASIIDAHYAENPTKFTDRLKEWKLDQKVGIQIKGEGTPVIPEPGHELWSKNALPSMAYGYNLRLTPLQVLTFYNAIANDGVMVKPKFIKEIREWNLPVEQFDTEIRHDKIASEETLTQIRDILKNIVKRGTGQSLYSEYFSMAGKTGTARTEYWEADWADNRRYISSFAGYFPAENPKYSCIVVIHKPSTKKGYYGADVTGPVFKRIAQKIFTDSPLIEEVQLADNLDPKLTSDFETYYKKVQAHYSKMPNVTGMAGMDAISLLENLGLRVVARGNGTVTEQSIESGEPLKEGQQIILKLS